MRKATVTYNAPVGDNKVCEMGGQTFFDGKSVELNSYDHPHLISKLKGNHYFTVEVGEDDNQPPPKVKRGRPSKADIAAAKEAAEKADQEVEAAKAKADAAKSDHEKLVNAPETEVTKPPAEGYKADMKAGMDKATAHDFEKDRQNEIARRDKPQDKPQGETNVLGYTGTSPNPPAG